MKLNRTDVALDRNARIKENENWFLIENNMKNLSDKFDNTVEEISDEAFEKVVNSIKLNWKEPVDTYSELPNSPEYGETRMVRESGKVYRYNGEEWAEIQEIDVGPVNDVESRLTEQISQTYYYEEIKSEKLVDPVSQTVYYLTTVPHTDKNGNLIKLKKEFQNDLMNSGSGETPRSFANRTGASLVTNASIWDNNDSMNIVGIQIKDGVILQDTPSTSYTLGVKEDNTLVAYPPTVTAEEILADGVVNTFTAFFPMIENGEEVDPSIYSIITNPSTPNPRQVIAQMPNKDIIFLTCEGRMSNNPGMTYGDCIRILKELGVMFAYCLDGGGSAQTVLRNVLINQPIDKNFTEERKVPDFIYFKKEVLKGRELSAIDVGEIGVNVKKHDVLIGNKVNKNGDTFTGRVYISTADDSTPVVFENDYSRIRFVGLENKNQIQSGYKDMTPKPTEFTGYNSTIIPSFDIFAEAIKQRKSTGLFDLMSTEITVVDDLFKINKTGFYRGISSTSNKPSQANCNCLYIGDENNGMLLALTFYTELFLVRKLNGVWADWREK